MEGHNLVIERRWAQGQVERLPELAAKLVRLQVDIIVAVSNAEIAAAKQATSTIPIVMVLGVDPVGVGLIASLVRPGGNITGTAMALPEVAGKVLEVLTEAVPHARRIAALFNPAFPGITAYGREFDVAAQALARGHGRTFQPVEVREPRDFDTAFVQIMQGRPDALYVVVDPIVATHAAQILHFAAQHKLPAIYTWRGLWTPGASCPTARASMRCPGAPPSMWTKF